MTVTRSFRRFQYFNFEKKNSEKRKPFSKNWSTILFVECTKSENATFPHKIYGRITKNKVLSVTTLFFRTFCFSLRTSHKELIWCNNYPNVHVHTFHKRWRLDVDMLKYPITMKHSDVNSQEPVSLNSLINENSKYDMQRRTLYVRFTLGCSTHGFFFSVLSHTAFFGLPLLIMFYLLSSTIT